MLYSQTLNPTSLCSSPRCRTTDIINKVQEAIAEVDEEALRNAQGGRAVAGYTAAIQKG